MGCDIFSKHKDTLQKHRKNIETKNTNDGSAAPAIRGKGISMREPGSAI